MRTRRSAAPRGTNGTLRTLFRQIVLMRTRVGVFQDQGPHGPKVPGSVPSTPWGTDHATDLMGDTSPERTPRSPEGALSHGGHDNCGNDAREVLAPAETSWTDARVRNPR
jgi:hypothetical protein